jgi:hypothetical protein
VIAIATPTAIRSTSESESASSARSTAARSSAASSGSGTAGSATQSSTGAVQSTGAAVVNAAKPLTGAFGIVAMLFGIL